MEHVLAIVQQGTKIAFWVLILALCIQIAYLGLPKEKGRTRRIK